jgi:hypothetical protein
MLPADASEDATFDCDTEPEFRSHRTGVFSFDAPFYGETKPVVLVVRGRLPMACRLNHRPALISSLLRHVQVSGACVRRGLVRLSDVTVVAGAENPNRDVAVRRLLLLRRCKSGRVLTVAADGR